MELKLERRAYLPHVTLGVLTCAQRTWVTLELPWRDNEPFKSCIPDGRYDVRRKSSRRFGETWEVLNVSRREAILFHAGNTTKDTEGCILIGTYLSEQDYAIGGSKVAMQELNACLSGVETIQLSVGPFAGARLP